MLILCPNKKHAKIIIEEIVKQLNNGNWKGISKKKRFKDEFSEADSLNDSFRIGISYDFENKKLRFYQPMDNSDIIISSPLGLKLTDLEEDNSNITQNGYIDYLSSIEILLLDFAEVFIYQVMNFL